MIQFSDELRVALQEVVTARQALLDAEARVRQILESDR